MDSGVADVDWWCGVSIRICHSSLDPTEVSALLKITPQIAQRPGETRIPHGDCRSAGYWCLTNRINAPERPDIAIHWAEQFIAMREPQLRQLLDRGYDVNIYMGIHTNVMAIGFDVPPTPKICELQIQLGVEFFSR